MVLAVRESPMLTEETYERASSTRAAWPPGRKALQMILVALERQVALKGPTPSGGGDGHAVGAAPGIREGQERVPHKGCPQCGRRLDSRLVEVDRSTTS